MRTLPSAHPFDIATAVTRTDTGLQGRTDERYRAFVGPFGGFTAATLLRAVLSHPKRQGDALAITVNYCAPIADGTFELDVEEARTNRSSQHWIVRLRQGDGIAATATVLTAMRRDPWSHQSSPVPAMPPPDRLATYEGARSFPWVRQYRFRFARGMPARLAPAAADGNADPAAEGFAASESHLWIQDDVPRPLDALSLTSMSDAFFARIFLVRGAVVPFGTMSITTYLHVSADELAAASATEVFGTVRANVFHRGFGDQTAELWLPSGQLAATTQQVTYFKT